jgi:acetyltransferase
LLDADVAKKRYTSKHRLRNGAEVTFRPIECADKDKFKQFFRSLSPASIHFRFFEIIKDLPEDIEERFCSKDYREEMAIVAEPIDGGIVAVGRLEVDGKTRRGEYAMVIADAWQGIGLGVELLGYLIGVAQDYGLLELHCYISSDNLRMIGLAERFSFTVVSSEDDILEMSLPLSGSSPARIA